MEAPKGMDFSAVSGGFLGVLQASGDGLALFLPGDIENRMFGPSLMADAILLAAESGGGDQRAFDPGDQGMDFSKRFEAFCF